MTDQSSSIEGANGISTAERNMPVAVKEKAQQSNNLLIQRGEGYQELLNQLRSEGWFSGSWLSQCAIILNTGELIPVGEGHHEPTQRKALKELGIQTGINDLVGRIFEEQGGIGIGFNSISVKELRLRDPRISTALRFLYTSVKRDTEGDIERGLNPWTVTIYDKNGGHIFDLRKLADNNFDVSVTLSTDNPNKSPLGSEEKRILTAQTNKAIDLDSTILKSAGVSQADIDFYMYWYSRIYAGDYAGELPAVSERRKIVYGRVDEKLTELERIVAQNRIKK